MEADQLDPVAEWLPAEPLAERLGGAMGEGGISVRLDLELDADRLRHQFDEPVQQKRMLGRRPSRGVTDERRSDLLRGPLVRPSIEGGPEREQGVVQQDEPIVGRQADVGLEALYPAAQGMAKRGRRGVWTVVATEPVGV